MRRIERNKAGRKRKSPAWFQGGFFLRLAQILMKLANDGQTDERMDGRRNESGSVSFRLSVVDFVDEGRRRRR
jgi:hypothetical protein